MLSKIVLQIQANMESTMSLWNYSTVPMLLGHKGVVVMNSELPRNFLKIFSFFLELVLSRLLCLSHLWIGRSKHSYHQYKSGYSAAGIASLPD